MQRAALQMMVTCDRRFCISYPAGTPTFMKVRPGTAAAPSLQTEGIHVSVVRPDVQEAVDHCRRRIDIAPSGVTP